MNIEDVFEEINQGLIPSYDAKLEVTLASKPIVTDSLLKIENDYYVRIDLSTYVNARRGRMNLFNSCFSIEEAGDFLTTLEQKCEPLYKDLQSNYAEEIKKIQIKSSMRKNF